MSLSCDCDIDWYPEPGDTYFDEEPKDFSVLNKARGLRCCSCNSLIKPGATVLKFTRVKIPNSDVEIKIYGEEGFINRAPRFQCETCGGIYLSLTDLGYCTSPTGDVLDALSKYHAIVKAKLCGK